MPAPSPLLLSFVEDELARAPALGEQVLQTVIDRSQAAGPQRSARDRQLEHDVVRGLAQYRPAIVRRFAQALREQAQDELAKSLRLACAAACTRLESQGIEPSMYRTIVQATGSRVVRPGQREETPATDLHDLLDSMPVPLDAPSSKSPPLEEVLLRADEML